MNAWFLTFSGWAAAASTPSAVVDVWVHVTDRNDRQIVSELGLGFVEQANGPWMRFHGEEHHLGALRRSGLDFREARRPAMIVDAGHHSPAEMVDQLEGLATGHPATVELVDIGTSVLGKPIVGLRIGRSSRPERRVRILGAHHGDETSSAELALQAANQLATDPGLSHLLDDTEFWVVPHINPDGVEMLSRYNANAVDLNRNYGFEWSASSFRPGSKPFSEPETQAVRALGSWIDFGLGLSMHSGAANLGWVWNYTTEHSGDESLLSDIADAYAEECTTDGFWTTNGAEWYVTNGDTTDWAYGRHGTLDYTLEVSVNKHPGPVEMASVLNQHLFAVPAIFDWPWWTSGWVTDAENGLPVPARVTLDENGQGLTTGPDGHFSRPVAEHEAVLTISSPGYQTEVVTVEPWTGPIEVELAPEALSAVTAVSPWISHDGYFELDGEASTVVLSRLGHDDVYASPSGAGWVVSDPTMNPGPWTIVIDGHVRPRALFLPEDGDEVRLIDIHYGENSVDLEVAGLGRGARIWRLAGTRRQFVRVAAVVDTERGVLTIPRDEFGDGEDLILWTRGRQLGIPAGDFDAPPVPDDSDSGDVPSEDTAPPSPWSEPPTESDSIDDGGKLRPGGCQVARPLRYPHPIWLVTLLGLVHRRRLPCAKPSCFSLPPLG